MKVEIILPDIAPQGQFLSEAQKLPGILSQDLTLDRGRKPCLGQFPEISGRGGQGEVAPPKNPTGSDDLDGERIDLRPV